MITMKDRYLTREGLADLRSKLNLLKTERRREIAEAIHTAKEQGDLSENAEYVSAKEEQRRLEEEIAELEGAIKHAKVIIKSDDKTHIDLGDTVTLECDGKEQTYAIVGSDEANPLEGKISNESPMGHALLGRKKGEQVKIPVPNGHKECVVVQIS